jgi:hypothetical protein
MRVTKFAINRVITDLYYTTKFVAGVLSGFDGLQIRFAGEWEYVEYSQVEKRDVWGNISRSFRYDAEEPPEHVCVLWKNGSHTPLDVIILADGFYPLQNAVAALLSQLPFVRAFYAALKAAVLYEHDHRDEGGDIDERNEHL